MRATNVRNVLVTGARGKTGREVVARLGERGVTVRAGSRVPGTSAGNVHPVRFDWDEPATWSEAVAGVDAVYLMRPDIEEAPARVAELAAMTPEAHVVLLSAHEKAAFAANAIALGGDQAWMSRRGAEALAPASRDALGQAGFTLRRAPLEAIEAAGGSLRCCIAEIY